jgi:hypothetical protein
VKWARLVVKRFCEYGGVWYPVDSREIAWRRRSDGGGVREEGGGVGVEEDEREEDQVWEC